MTIAQVLTILLMWKSSLSINCITPVRYWIAQYWPLSLKNLSQVFINL